MGICKEKYSVLFHTFLCKYKVKFNIKFLYFLFSVYFEASKLREKGVGGSELLGELCLMRHRNHLKTVW